MTYDYLDNGDMGFKLLDNKNYSDPNERLYHLPYLFKRSEIENAIRTRPPQNLYLRSTIRKEDYEIKFSNAENLRTFLKLFPNKVYDDRKTRGYFFMVGK